MNPHLNGVLNGVREVLHRARRGFLLWWILRRRVGLCEVWDDDLGVALGTEGARFKQRLLVEDAALVHVLTSLNIIQSVGDTIDRGEEVRVVDVCMEPLEAYL